MQMMKTNTMIPVLVSAWLVYPVYGPRRPIAQPCSSNTATLAKYSKAI